MQLYFVSGYTHAFPYFAHHTFRNEHILQQDYNCWLLLEEYAIAKVYASRIALHAEKVFWYKDCGQLK
jgi:hypothetical protein